MTEPIFLGEAQVEALHRAALDLHGGRRGTRDLHAFRSAVLQPRNVYHYTQGDLFEVAAAYAFYIAQSQAFVDGNKPTGMAAALVFLRLNGISVGRATEELHSAMISLSERRLGRLEFAAVLRRLARG